MRIRGGLPFAVLLAALPLVARAESGTAGRVIGFDGSPLAGAVVEAFDQESAEQAAERRAAGSPRTPLATATAAADGSFRLEGTRPFAWVQASAPGHAPAAVAGREGGSVTIALPRVALRRGVITASGRPVAGAVVYSFWDGAELVARTDPQGAYEVPDPVQAPARLIAIHPDFAPLDSDENDRPGLDRQLDAGVGIAGTAIEDGSGRPVSNALVWVDDTWPLARTDAKGAFVIAHAPRQWSRVTVQSPQRVGHGERKAGTLVVRMQVARTLTGTVTDKATRQPLAGATVAVYPRSGSSRSAVTDARGRYTLEGLVPARYRPFVARDGYAFSGGGLRDDTQPGVDLRTASGRFDAALDPLPRVRGRVEDEQHRPVGGAMVLVGARDAVNVYATIPGDAFGPFAGASTRTAPDGTFELAIPDDSHGFIPTPRSGGRGPRVAALAPGFAAGRAEVEAGDGQAPVVLTLARGVELAGRITDPDGAPVAGVAVSAAENGSIGGAFPSHMLLTSVKHEGWTTSDDAGRFALRVHPGSHHLFFTRPGSAPKLVRGHDPATGPLEVVLEPGATVRGRVTRADGRGVADASVGIAESAAHGLALAEGVVTGADGRFELAGLAPGVYELGVEHEELGLSLTRTVEAPADDVQFTLAPSVTLRGRVLDAATRQPVPRYDVTVSSTGPPESSHSLAAEDPAGAFVFEEVAVGDAEVAISAEGYTDRTIEGLSLEADSEPAPLEILLEADAPIRGRITDASGAPIADASVSAATEVPASTHASSDDEGEYEVRGLPAGVTKLSFSADGYVSEERTLDSRESARLDVALKRGLALRGQVVKAGVGVAQAYVRAQSSVRGSRQQSTQTDEKGHFAVEGLVPGRYTVTANTSEGGSARLEDVDAQTSGPLRLTLDKAATAVVRGKVVGLSEEDAGLAMVVAANEETGESAHDAVDSSMAFRIEDSPAGRVKVRAFTMGSADGARGSRTVELNLAPGSETETVVEFASDIVVSGTVTRDGAAVPFVRVSFSGEELSASARADGRGFYRVVGLEAGLHQVSVSGDDLSFQTEYVVTASAELDIDVTGGSIEGRVVRAEGGTPVPDVEVSFFRLGGSENKPIGSSSTGSTGAFVERSLREGSYRLITSKAGYGQVVRDVEVARGAAAEVLIELTPADGVGVTVVDARDSRPLEAIVVVRDLSRRIVANRHGGAAAGGSVNIPLADGSYLLSTSATGYGTVTVPVTAPAQGLRIGLTPGGTLVIESERDLRGRVRLVQPDGEEYVRCWCNGIADIQLKGRRTSVENVTPGSYTVEIVDSPEVTAPRPVVVREGQTSTIAIE